MLNEGNQIHNFISSSGTVINYGSTSGSDFLTNYGSGYVWAVAKQGDGWLSWYCSSPESVT